MSEIDSRFQYQQTHPWHGINPEVGNGVHLAFIENTPLSAIKYEVDQETGYLRVDTPLYTSALVPAAYGFIPRTLCGSRVAQLETRLRGDRAALDVFVLSERPLDVPGVLAPIKIIGGIPVRDESYVDDKLIAVLDKDAGYGQFEEIHDIPVYIVDRISHFLSQSSFISQAIVGDAFGRDRALTLLKAALDDYQSKFG